MSYKVPDLQERQSNAIAARKAMLEKFRAAAQDPEVEKRRAARVALHEARLVRIAEREAAKKAHQAEIERQAAEARERALQAERDAAERAAKAQREAEQLAAMLAAEEAERAAALAAEQKAARDARYAARKAAKKVRRRGY
jgi:hypothetical protein